MSQADNDPSVQSSNHEREPAKEHEGNKDSKESAFVAYIVGLCSRSNGVSAQLSRADNPATEYQSWDVLAGFKVRLDWDNQRLPYALIAAAVARGKVKKNGSTGIGSALAKCYPDGQHNSQAIMKLRRLLACDSTAEACGILRTMLSLIQSRGVAGMDYASLLKDLLRFDLDTQQTRIKAKWAQDFYTYRNDNKEVTVNG